MNGHACDNCESPLENEDYVEFGSWSYTCPKCGFRYIHGRGTAEEQVYKFNHNGRDRADEQKPESDF